MTQPCPHLIACSVFRRELDSLIASGAIPASVTYLDSMLHMFPEKLEVQLSAALADTRAHSQKTVVVYGDCHARMVDMSEKSDVGRTCGINCCEIILGKDEYRRLRKEGVFFFIPEWAMRWKEIFFNELGLTRETVGPFFRDMHTRLMYLDTGLIPVPVRELDEIAALTGLPMEVRVTSLDELRKSVRRALQELEVRSGV